MAAPGKRKRLFGGVVLLLAALFLCTLVLFYQLTRPSEIEFAQDPNPVEAHEANRKLRLLAQARESNRFGWVRLSEVEINSFIETSYSLPTNAPANPSVRIVKSGVLLHPTNLTFITWIEKPLLRWALPFVWQRTVTPKEQDGKWVFEVTSMTVGNVNIPEKLWPKVGEAFGAADAIFEERRAWVEKLPWLALLRNELSSAPELRLYSRKPEDVTAQ